MRVMYSFYKFYISFVKIIFPKKREYAILLQKYVNKYVVEHADLCANRM